MPIFVAAAVVVLLGVFGGTLLQQHVQQTRLAWASNPVGRARLVIDRFFARAARVGESATRHREAASQWTQRAGRIRSAVWRGETPSTAHIVVILALATFWMVFFSLQMSLDIMLFGKLGEPHPTAYGVTFATGMTVVGILLAGMLGMHGKKFLQQQSWPVLMKRLALSVGVLAAAGAILFLMHVAPYRSAQELQPRLDRATLTLSLARQASPPDGTLILADQQAVELIRNQMTTASHLDEAIVVILAAGEIVLSFAPFMAVELGLAGASTGAAWWHRVAAARKDRRRQRLANRMGRILRRHAVALGLSPQSADGWMDQAQTRDGGPPRRPPTIPAAADSHDAPDPAPSDTASPDAADSAGGGDSAPPGPPTAQQEDDGPDPLDGEF